ncbi:MAG TPA: helix-turn-helix domain-containing protein [Chthoniobacteraceae bacterium]|nr:helix-turn-helix domain-containing protein [Chthoniobacteraceae bacterium]
MIGPQIRKLRYKMGWSQDQLAAKLQIAGLDNRADAVVIIRHAETLPRNLSFVTPHDVWIEESFNTPSDPGLVRSASIVTSGRVIGVAE